MTYEPQPGTIPHRVLVWLRSMAKVNPGKEPSTPEICEALDVDGAGFTAYMRPAREHGLVHTRRATLGRFLYWRLGDGTPDPLLALRGRDKPIQRPEPADQELKPGPMMPGVAATAESEALRNEFRALAWDGYLLATGMEVVNGVAIFTPEMVQVLKRQTDWIRL